MTAPIIVVAGTGTGIGKTHVAASLVGAWARLLEQRQRGPSLIAGLKPIESGVTPGADAGHDGEVLAKASTFHVKRFRPPYLLELPLSPHLAARTEGRSIDVQRIVDWVDEIRPQTNGVVVELAGGLFSPLGAGLSNADVARALEPDALVLVAPDRLGVLHDVGATVRAATASGLTFDGILLSTPEAADDATGINAAEMGMVCSVPVLTTLPRASVEELAASPSLATVLRALIRSLA